MRRFLIPIVILIMVSFGGLYFLLNYSSPFIEPISEQGLIVNNRHIALFLIFLFSTTLFSSTLIFYFFYRLIGDYLEPRLTLRRAFRHGFLGSLGLLTCAVLQLTETLNLLTFILTIAVVFSLEFSFHATR